ncbi:hypothetical protein [Actinosynnema sp. ALI-1.44]|uniref:hypothetical protein n=1 Tax=Actinosynnema sp. ALI-1.44 TaxID=1933779 RepID=UPI00192CF405|nr:hypothetical protein [Actinosynnema sp. ALI-1.44]
MHSPVDEYVGIDNARRIFDAAHHPKSFVALDGANHLLTDKCPVHRTLPSEISIGASP